jgi:hypothetical protein
MNEELRSGIRNMTLRVCLVMVCLSAICGLFYLVTVPILQIASSEAHWPSFIVAMKLASPWLAIGSLCLALRLYFDETESIFVRYFVQQRLLNATSIISIILAGLTLWATFSLPSSLIIQRLH